MITLSSDFGSPYPAAMKGVILSRTDARLVDVAHDFPRQDVRQAAFWLREVLPYFPPSVHLVVVDPGVGTDRAVLVARADEHVLVGPDNGVLVPVAEKMADPPDYFVTTPDAPESTTFHGRDVFAPLAATLHENGVESVVDDDRFARTESVESITFPSPDIEGDEAHGEVLVVDGFGNVITNVPGSFLDGVFGGTITVDRSQTPVERTYAAVDIGDPLVTVGSHGNVELAVNQGRGDRAFDVAVGDAVMLAR